MIKHIEGPYTLVRPGEGINDSKHYEIHDCYGRTATVYGEIGDPEVVATGALLAASPRLYAAAKVIALTPEIRMFLQRQDPQALRQLDRAITSAEMGD